MKKTKIEWADYTWNPVSGCLHGCEYCYARKIANRFGGGGYGKEWLCLSQNTKMMPLSLRMFWISRS